MGAFTICSSSRQFAQNVMWKCIYDRMTVSEKKTQLEITPVTSYIDYTPFNIEFILFNTVYRYRYIYIMTNQSYSLQTKEDS